MVFKAVLYNPTQLALERWEEVSAEFKGCDVVVLHGTQKRAYQLPLAHRLVAAGLAEGKHYHEQVQEAGHSHTYRPPHPHIVLAVVAAAAEDEAATDNDEIKRLHEEMQGLTLL